MSAGNRVTPGGASVTPHVRANVRVESQFLNLMLTMLGLFLNYAHKGSNRSIKSQERNRESGVTNLTFRFKRVSATLTCSPNIGGWR